MLARDWSEKWKAEGEQAGIVKGEQIGIAKGRVEGRVEGESLLLRKQLIKRWGTLPDWVEQKLTAANSAQLEVWGENIFDADSLETLFEVGGEARTPTVAATELPELELSNSKKWRSRHEL